MAASTVSQRDTPSEQQALPFAQLARQLPVPVVCTAGNHTIQWCNQAFAELARADAAALMGRSLLEFFPSNHAERLVHHLQVLENAPLLHYHLWVQMQPSRGPTRWVALRSQLQHLDGKTCWAHVFYLLEETMALPYSQNEFLSERFVQGWVRVLNARDLETSVHTRRVADLTVMLGTALGVSATTLRAWRWGALLHDIGKIAIPDSILHKTGPLTEEEWEVMRQHPLLAQSIIQEVSFLPREVLEIPLYHHERCDGSGYPFGLFCHQIPLSARVFAVVDVWDALSRERPYRKAWPHHRIEDYLRGEGQHLFDHEVLEAFERLRRQTRFRLESPHRPFFVEM